MEIPFEFLTKTENQMLNHVISANRNEQSDPIRSDPVRSDPDFVDAALFTSFKVILGYFRFFKNSLKVILCHFQGLGRFNRQMSLWPLSLESYGPFIKRLGH